VRFFDFNGLPLFWRHLTAFQLVPEAVDESWELGTLFYLILEDFDSLIRHW
jgi:hypothetical protein